MYKFILFLPLVLTLYLTSSQANAGPSVDVTTLDIAGVKIGMSADEAIAALIDTYGVNVADIKVTCLLYTSPSPRDLSTSRMPSSA